MGRPRTRLLVVAAAAIAGGVGYFLTSGPLLALSLGVIYGAAGWLTSTYSDALPTEGTWAVSKWNGVWIFSLTLAVNAVLNGVLDIPLRTGVSVVLVIYGASWLGFVIAVAQLTEAERAAT